MDKKKIDLSELAVMGTFGLLFWGIFSSSYDNALKLALYDFILTAILFYILIKKGIIFS